MIGLSGIFILLYVLFDLRCEVCGHSKISCYQFPYLYFFLLCQLNSSPWECLRVDACTVVILLCCVTSSFSASYLVLRSTSSIVGDTHVQVGGPHLSHATNEDD